MAEEGVEATFPCKVCGRHFVKSSLSKHEPACKKLTKMQRKVFDSGKQRAAHSDVPYKDIKKAAKEKEKYGGIFPRPATHWRERHEEFISAVSASKNVKEALKTGGPLPPPPKTSVNSDYICCVHCGRNFSERAAEKHIPFCKEQHMRKQTSAVPQSQSRSSSTSRVSTTGAAAKNPPSTGHKSQKGDQYATPPTASSKSSTSTRANRPPSRTSSKERPPTNSSLNSQFSGTTIGGVAIGGGGAASNAQMSRLQSRRSTDADRPPAPSSTYSNTNSHAQRSQLPTPAKRTTSAPRNAPLSQSSGQVKAQ